MDQRKKKLIDVLEQQKAVEDKYGRITAELAPIDDLLKRQRENVTFAEFVSAEGMKEVEVRRHRRFSAWPGLRAAIA
jgi:hypothetical protein